MSAPRNLQVRVRTNTDDPEAVGALLEWAAARSESAADDELIYAAAGAINITVAPHRTESDLLDALPDMAAVTFHHIGLGGSYEWTVAAHGPTERDQEQKAPGISVRRHVGDEQFTLHVSFDGPTRASALAGAVDLYERHREILDEAAT